MIRREHGSGEFQGDMVMREVRGSFDARRLRGNFKNEEPVRTSNIFVHTGPRNRRHLNREEEGTYVSYRSAERLIMVTLTN